MCPLILAMLMATLSHQRVDMIVQPNCLLKPLHFIDCDLSDVYHPKCKQMATPVIKPGCEEIHIERVK